MISTLSECDFLNWWPESRRDQFSLEALRALFEYYEELADDCGTVIEYDPIAICCDWTEYDTPAEALEEYGLSSFTLEGQKWLEGYETTILRLDSGGIVVQNY